MVVVQSPVVIVYEWTQADELRWPIWYEPRWVGMSQTISMILVRFAKQEQLAVPLRFVVR
jgi:hypothetical protein